MQENIGTLRRRGVARARAGVGAPRRRRQRRGAPRRAVRDRRRGGRVMSLPAASAAADPADLDGVRLLVTAGGHGSRSTRSVSSATARRASRATPSPRRRADAGPTSPSSRPSRDGAAASSRLIEVETAAEMAEAVLGVAGDQDVDSDGRRRGRLPARDRRSARKLRKADGRATRSSSSRRTDILAELGRSGATARCSSASPPRPTTWPGAPRGKLAPKGADLVVANDVGRRRGRLRPRDERRDDRRDGRRRPTCPWPRNGP